MGTEDRDALMRRLRESSVNLCAKYDFLKEVMCKSDEIDYDCKVQICTVYARFSVILGHPTFLH